MSIEALVEQYGITLTTSPVIRSYTLHFQGRILEGESYDNTPPTASQQLITLFDLSIAAEHDRKVRRLSKRYKLQLKAFLGNYYLVFKNAFEIHRNVEIQARQKIVRENIFQSDNQPNEQPKPRVGFMSKRFNEIYNKEYDDIDDGYE